MRFWFTMQCSSSSSFPKYTLCVTISTRFLQEMGKWNSQMFPIYTSAMTVILNVVDGADVATNEDSEDVISLYTTGRRRCDAVTE